MDEWKEARHIWLVQIPAELRKTLAAFRGLRRQQKIARTIASASKYEVKTNG